jgi:hypothetical protein
MAAFFGSVIAVGAFDLLGIDGGWVEFLLALLVAAFTGGAVYSKERLGFAKARENGAPPPAPPTTVRRKP